MGSARALLPPWHREGPFAGSHAGLVLDRHLADQSPAEQRTLIDRAAAAIESLDQSGLYRTAFERRRVFFDKAVPAERRCAFDMDLTGRAVIGLGRASVTETGLTLHSTFGVPFLPGSSLKGLVSHYAAERGTPDVGFLFGTLGERGAVTFHDAWILPESLKGCLRLDVMTVHHPEYYRGEDRFPLDVDDPNPVPFVSFGGTFRVLLTTDVDDPAMKPWLDLAQVLVTQALYAWGIGGKTRSGYGRARPASDRPVPPMSEVGSRIQAKRGPDPQGKNRPWFYAIDGSGHGNVLDRGTEDQNSEIVTLVVVSKQEGRTRHYTFCWPDAPQAPKPPRAGPLRGGPKGNQRRG